MIPTDKTATTRHVFAAITALWLAASAGAPAADAPTPPPTGMAERAIAPSSPPVTPPASDKKPVVDLSAERIVQIGLVVRDVDKVARRFSDVFGNSWAFYDFRPKDIVVREKVPGGVDCYLKVALAQIGGRSFKLIQPVSGPSSHMDFLQKNGEGFYTLGLGTLINHDAVVAALKKAGVGIEMQGGLGNDATFTILDLAEDLGCRIEFNSPAIQSAETNMQMTGAYVPKSPGLINMDKPHFAGGKRFMQVGIVLKDEKKAARRFQELFGIGNWNLTPIPRKSEVYLNERLVTEAEMPALQNDAAFGYWGDLQLEVLRPYGLGASCHQWFLDKHGNGIQHLSLGRQADYDDVIAALKKGGIHSEYSATVGGTRVVNYLAMQDQMGGMQLEILKNR